MFIVVGFVNMVLFNILLLIFILVNLGLRVIFLFL